MRSAEGQLPHYGEEFGRTNSYHEFGGVVNYINNCQHIQDTRMTIPEEFTVPQAASYLNVSEETVRRNIRSKRLMAFRRGTQWFIQHDVLVLFANSYNPKTGKVRKLL